MKRLNNSFIRSMAALLLGLFLILYPEHLGSMLVIFVGALFFLPSLFFLLSDFSGKKKRKQTLHKNKSLFSFLSTGSLLFGLWLMIMPDFFIGILLLLLGIILIAGGAQQLNMLFRASKIHTVSIYLYIMPVILLIAGFVVLTNPFGAMRTGFLFVGICCLIYGVFELINTNLFRSIYLSEKKKEEDIQEADIIDE